MVINSDCTIAKCEGPAEAAGMEVGSLIVGINADSVASKADIAAIIKALDETFDIYSNVSAAMPRWDLEEAGHAPMGAPFHPGAIRYLEEKGIWNDEDQAWNDKRLKRLEALQSAWEETVEAHPDASEEAFAEAWAERRAAAIESL